MAVTESCVISLLLLLRLYCTNSKEALDIHNRKGCMRFIRSGYSLGGMGEYNVEKNVEK